MQKAQEYKSYLNLCPGGQLDRYEDADVVDRQDFEKMETNVYRNKGRGIDAGDPKDGSCVCIYHTKSAKIKSISKCPPSHSALMNGEELISVVL